VSQILSENGLVASAALQKRTVRGVVKEMTQYLTELKAHEHVKAPLQAGSNSTTVNSNSSSGSSSDSSSGSGSSSSNNTTVNSSNYGSTCVLPSYNELYAAAAVKVIDVLKSCDRITAERPVAEALINVDYDRVSDDNTVNIYIYIYVCITSAMTV